MNRYPLWKYLLILGVLLGCVVYALPNVYPEDPSLQVTSSGSATIGPEVEERVANVLKQQGLEFKSMQREEEKLLIRFDQTETQLEAFETVKEALGSNFVTALNLARDLPGWLRGLGAQPMYLGLDLRGGVHFLLEVDMTAAVAKAIERYETDFRTTLREEKINYLGVFRSQNTLQVKFRSGEERDAGESALNSAFRGELDFSTAMEGDTQVLNVRLRPQTEEEIRKFALSQNITSLRKRVNELGVAEPVIQQQGTDRVVVQLPGVQDTARAKKILGATATLEFRLVNEQGDAIAAAATKQIPSGDRLYYERNGNPILLRNRVLITGEYITDAASGIDQQTAGPAVFITLDGKGARIFSKVTGENIKKLMAVVFIETKPDGRKTEEVINVARIQDQLGKRFQITGLDSTREARDLALLLRAGALAAPMRFIEERTIGPSLGQANIDQGVKSVVIGFLLVVVLMAVYYRVFGLFAVAALVMNLVILVAVLSMLQATLTLPGIAGIVLTLGMAVDANVLIFERIREELRWGNSPQAAINAGYERAFATIVDSNVTTLLATLILFMFGTGPVKGFAVTLSIGILTSMFTAILGTRALVNIFLGKRRLQSLPI
ncbi:MAG: protein translocase subunit SecD [Thiotrichales bacterium]